MLLKLKVISGPGAGALFDLNPGLIIGRGQADIVLNDSKISGQHARVERDPKGQLCLVDLGSTNGLRVGGKKVTQVPLQQGIKIKIGRVEVEVITEEKGKSSPTPKPAKSRGPKSRPPLPAEDESVPNIEMAPQTWREYLLDFSRQARSKFKNQPKEIKPFKPLVTMRFMRGIQVGTEWVIGYGPRRVGIGSLDLHLFEAEAPPIAFVVSPTEHGAHFQTDHPAVVRLNGERISSETLKDGDSIEIGETIIRIGFRS